MPGYLVKPVERHCAIGARQELQAVPEQRQRIVAAVTCHLWQTEDTRRHTLVCTVVVGRVPRGGAAGGLAVAAAEPIQHLIERARGRLGLRWKGRMLALPPQRAAQHGVTLRGGPVEGVLADSNEAAIIASEKPDAVAAAVRERDDAGVSLACDHDVLLPHRPSRIGIDGWLLWVRHGV